MSRLHRSTSTALAVAAFALLAGACTGDGTDTAATGTAPPADAASAAPDDSATALETIPLPGATATPAPAPAAPAQEATDPPPQRSLEIVSPADGATVSAPVTLEVRVDGFTLAPIDGSFEEDSGHLYAYVDTPLPTEQVRIPEDPAILRFSEPQVQLPDLEPGEHTIGVIAAHGYPVPMMPVVSDEVTITVE